jgi:hypothetical protein
MSDIDQLLPKNSKFDTNLIRTQAFELESRQTHGK